MIQSASGREQRSAGESSAHSVSLFGHSSHCCADKEIHSPSQISLLRPGPEGGCVDESTREKFERDGRVSLCAINSRDCCRGLRCLITCCRCAGMDSYFWQQLSAKVLAKLPRKRTLGVWLADTPNGAGGGVWPAPHLSSLPPGSFVRTPVDMYCLSICLSLSVSLSVCLCVPPHICWPPRTGQRLSEPT